MPWPTILVALFIAALMVLAFYKLYKSHKNGECCGGCSGCAKVRSSTVAATAMNLPTTNNIHTFPENVFSPKQQKLRNISGAFVLFGAALVLYKPKHNLSFLCIYMW